MSYQIQYGVCRVEQRYVQKKPNIKLILSVLLLTGILTAVTIWPEWAREFRQELFPILSEQGIRAVKAFSENLRIGQDLQGAIGVFCEEILGGSVS